MYFSCIYSLLCDVIFWFDQEHKPYANAVCVCSSQSVSYYVKKYIANNHSETFCKSRVWWGSACLSSSPLSDEQHDWCHSAKAMTGRSDQDVGIVRKQSVHSAYFKNNRIRKNIKRCNEVLLKWVKKYFLV